MTGTKTIFTPKHPEKYLETNNVKPSGERGVIISRSNWELQIMKAFDENPNVLKWGSEAFFINYVHPFSKKLKKYYPDFIIVIVNKKKQIQVIVIEIKPKKEAKPGSRKAYDKAIRMVNAAKWKAAMKYCEIRGWLFKVLTEDELKFIR